MVLSDKALYQIRWAAGVGHFTVSFIVEEQSRSDSVATTEASNLPYPPPPPHTHTHTHLRLSVCLSLLLPTA